MSELVSIVIPVYNMGKTISNSVESLLNQTYQNLEILLVDDGSTDDSYEKCCALKNLDKRVKAVHTENRGSGPARNEGIAKATGRYIYFPDADDYLQPNAIEILVKTIQENDCDLVVFGFENVNHKGKVTNHKEYEKKCFSSNDLRMNYSECVNYTAKWAIQGAPWNKFFDLKIIKAHHIMYPSLRRHQDEGFIGRYMSFSNKVAFISDVLYIYHINDLKREWDKYPQNYIDCVIGLYECRKENILAWNPKDTKTRNLVESAYVAGVIKALELAFSSRYNFKSSERKAFIEGLIMKSNIMDFNLNFTDQLKYQKKVLSLIKKQANNRLYALLAFKVFVERKFSNAFHWIKR